MMYLSNGVFFTPFSPSYICKESHFSDKSRPWDNLKSSYMDQSFQRAWFSHYNVHLHVGDDPSTNYSFTSGIIVIEKSVPSIRFEEGTAILRHMGSLFNITCSPLSFW